MERRGFKTYDAALIDLLNRELGQGRAAPARPQRPLTPDRDEKPHQPLSFSYLSECTESMTYFTGLTKEAVTWLIEPLEKAVRLFFVCFFFFFFLGVCDATVFHGLLSEHFVTLSHRLTNPWRRTVDHLLDIESFPRRIAFFCGSSKRDKVGLMWSQA